MINIPPGRNLRVPIHTVLRIHLIHLRRVIIIRVLGDVANVIRPPGRTSLIVLSENYFPRASLTLVLNLLVGLFDTLALRVPLAQRMRRKQWLID